jgi:sortase A
MTSVPLQTPKSQGQRERRAANFAPPKSRDAGVLTGADDPRERAPPIGNTPAAMAVHAPSSGARRRSRLAVAAAIIGALLLVDAVLTVVWQEPVTAVAGRIEQHRLAGDLDRLMRAGPTPAERRAAAALPDRRARVASLARALGRRTPHGAAVGRIVIPRMNTNMVVVKGSDGASLRKGPGFYDRSPLPGVPGTVAIAGHRTTFLAPFRHIDRLRRGDTITLRMPYATFTYRVDERRIVQPDATWITRNTGYDRLVLSACHPLFSAARRIVVSARLRAIAAPGRH